MRSVLSRLLVILALAMGALDLEPAHAAYQPGAVVQLPNIAKLASSDYSNTPQVQFSGYYTPNDGGQGTAIIMDTPCTPDGGSCFSDAAGNTFQRTNLNGDFRQWGLTLNSVYDAIANPTTVQGVSTLMTTAISVSMAAGIMNFDTNGVSLYLDNGLTLPSLTDFGCSLPAGGQLKTSLYNAVPGSLVLKHGTVITTANTIGGIIPHNCVVIPQMLINPSVVSAWTGFSMTYPPLIESDLEFLRGNMIKAGDTGIYVNQTRAVKPHDLYVYGFNTCYHYTKSDHMNLDRFWGDCNVGMFGDGGGGQSDYTATDIEPFLTKQANNAVVTCNPTGTKGNAGVCNEEYWNISSIAASPVLNSFGRPNCRMTLTLGIGNAGNPTINFPGTDLRSSSLMANGDPYTYPAWMANLQTNGYGATGCLGTGPYAISVISSSATGAVVDVLESEYSTGATKITNVATYDASSPVLRIASGDTRNLQIGMIVAGANIPVGTTITRICRSCTGPDPTDGYIAEVWLSANTTTSSSGDQSVTFDGGTFSSSDTCNGAGSGGCFFINADERVYSYADSTTPTGAAGYAISLLPLSNGRSFAASYAVNGTPGTRSINAFGYGHHYEFALNNANNCVFLEQHNDDNGELDDYSNVDMDVDGGGSYCTVSTNGLGKSGIAIATNLYQVPESQSSQSTISGIVSTAAGVTVTTNSSMATWRTDMGTGVAQGKLTVAICQSKGSDPDCTGHSEELANAEYIDTTHLLLLARGRFFTPPTAFTNGANIIVVNVGSSTGLASFANMVASTTDTGLNVAELAHGSLQLSGIYSKAGGRGIVISHNAVTASFMGVQASFTTLYYEDTTAVLASSGCGNSFLIQQPWECYGSVPIAPGSITTNFTLDGSAHSWKCDATTGNVTITVPLAGSFPNWDYEITKVDNTSNLCVITMSGGNTIGGTSGAGLAILNDAIAFKNDNGTTNWILQ